MTPPTVSWAYIWPLWATGLGILAIFLVSIEIGMRIGGHFSRAGREVGEVVGGDVTITALLGLLGLLLAFTYGFSLSRYDERREGMINEVNAIGTAFHRADLLPEPGGTRLQRRLLEYARTRQFSVQMFRTMEETARTFERTLQAQAALWPATRAALTEEVAAPVSVAVVAAINNVLDVHTQRKVAGFDNIPAVVLVLLVVSSALSLAMTAHNAAFQGNRSRLRLIVLALVLAALITIILDFDMPLSGLIRVGRADIDNLIADMEAALAS